MAFFEWKDRMSVGDPAVDRDHQTLIQYVNEMHEAALSGYGKEMVGPMLDKLAAYTREHFAREEALWKAGNYADCAKHKKEHADCLKTIAEFQARFGSGSIALAIDLAHFMNHWLKSHTLKSDHEAAEAIEAAREVPYERPPRRRASAQ
jgi:hemerythrin-like metal-binding protein